jgi:hypothetical protein
MVPTIYTSSHSTKMASGNRWDADMRQLRPQSVPAWLSDFASESSENSGKSRQPPVVKLPARSGEIHSDLPLSSDVDNADRSLLMRPRAPIHANPDTVGKSLNSSNTRQPQGGRRRRPREAQDYSMFSSTNQDASKTAQASNSSSTTTSSNEKKGTMNPVVVPGAASQELQLEEQWETLRIAATRGPGRNLESFDGESWERETTTVSGL